MLAMSKRAENEMTPRLLAFALVFGSTYAASAWGHHSPAMYEATERITLVGIVQELQWNNPHVWLYMVVEDVLGQPGNWVLEGGAPATLIRQGWPSGNPKPGDEITVIVRPLKTGARGGLIREVTFANGSEFVYTPDRGPPGG